jgi:pyruvate ferredoxin oxidoreductase gamma subunit
MTQRALPEGGGVRCGEDRGMFQVRFHGRGGQGVVTALGCRLSRRPPGAGVPDVRLRAHRREPITEPEAVVVHDPTLLHQVDLFAGLGADGYLLVNTGRSLAELGLGDFAKSFVAEHLLTVPATEIARRHVGRPLPNAVLLGALAALADVVSLDSVTAAIAEKFTGDIGRRNIHAAEVAYSLVRPPAGALTVV